MRRCLEKEISYRTSRSSGPGGQHVNKTESKVELYWDLTASRCLNESQKMMVRQRLVSRMTGQGTLSLSCDKYRSQYRNKAEVTERFLELIASAIIPVRKRLPTKPTRSSVEKRIRSKKIRGDIKRSRRHRPEE